MQNSSDRTPEIPKLCSTVWGPPQPSRIRSNGVAKPKKEISKGVIVRGKKYSYSVHSMLGKGSYGIVYKADSSHQRTLTSFLASILPHFEVAPNETVALKQFSIAEDLSSVNDTLIIEEQAIKIFKESFFAMSRLEHENVAKVYEMFEEGDELYISMEYIDGETLYDYINNNGTMSEEKATAIIDTISSCLGYCAEKGFYHGDLKPNNIMLDKQGKIKLIDFYPNSNFSDLAGLGSLFYYCVTGELAERRKLYDQSYRQQLLAKLQQLGIKSETCARIYRLLGCNTMYDVIIPIKHAIDHKEIVGIRNKFRIIESNGKYGVINLKGELVVPLRYDAISRVDRQHIPGPGPYCGHSIIGVETKRGNLTGWYKVVEPDCMELEMEVTPEQYYALSILT